MKYFYIVLRNKMVIEITYSEQAYQDTQEQLINKGLLSVRPKGQSIPITINSVDVSSVLTEEAYSSYVKTVDPKQYIKNGTWYDSKDNKVIRHENWKQKEIDEIKKLENKEYKPLTEKERDEVRKKIKDIGKSLSFLKQKKKTSN